MKKSAKGLSLLVPGLLAVLFLFLLLSAPSLAVEGAKNGLLLWGMVVLPTLFPFMVCSCAIVGFGAVPWLVKPLKPLLTGILGLSENGSYVLLSGLLCGYPMGAGTCGEFAKTGRITWREARYLLAVSNHPSPMFLLGYVMSQLAGMPGLPSPIPAWRVLVSLYLPILPLAALARRLYGIPAGDPRLETAENVHKEVPVQAVPFSLDEALLSCAETMVKIGGYIMLFSILALYAAKLPFAHPFLRAALLGVIEITTGIQAIVLSVPGPAGALLAVAAAAFGGLSGIFQTKSVLPKPGSLSGETKNAGLSIRHYVLWKALHTLGSVSCFILTGFLPQ